MQVTIVGAGYVGLTTGVVMAYLGHQVTVLDTNPYIIDNLKKGKSVIYEQGIEELLQAASENINFSSSFSDTGKPQIIMLAVGTPSKNNGDADLSFLEKAVREIALHLEEGNYPLIVNKSTVPPGTAHRLQTLINNSIADRGWEHNLLVASNPEFLQEGSAVSNILYPDRIIFGACDEPAFNLLEELYEPILKQDFPLLEYIPRPEDYTAPFLIKTDPSSAELAKYAANAFLSMKISFINEFAHLAELLGANIEKVAAGMGLDKRIGTKFLHAGAGWGGSCFGKDARAITYTAKKYGYSLSLVEAAMEVNSKQRKRVISKLQNVLNHIPGSTIGIMGLAFKPNTDDVRDTPAADIIRQLLNMGAFIKVYDPMAMDNFLKFSPDLEVKYCADIEELAMDCDALVLLTEWEQFHNAPWQEMSIRMRQKAIIDGRNMLNPQLMQDYGFTYQGMGRRFPSNHNPSGQ